MKPAGAHVHLLGAGRDDCPLLALRLLRDSGLGDGNRIIHCSNRAIRRRKASRLTGKSATTASISSDTVATSSPWQSHTDHGTALDERRASRSRSLCDRVRRRRPADGSLWVRWHRSRAGGLHRRDHSAPEPTARHRASELHPPSMTTTARTRTFYSRPSGLLAVNLNHRAASGPLKLAVATGTTAAHQQVNTERSSALDQGCD
jgi:hypothetical protein